MRVAKIYRYPVKGFTPDALESTGLTAGAGLPFDRCCGFTSGNLPDPPVAGGWVPARTFLQLTVYPELARFKAQFDDEAQSITVTAPDGRSASATLRDGGDFTDVDTLIRSHFEAGPHAIPELHVQAPGRGHWDFTDTGISLINLASVRELAQAVGDEIDPLRFRGNLFLDDMPAWSEFAMIGRRYKIGGAVVEITRPAMRCAATTVDPATADTGLNVPAILRKLTGHLYCGVYGRVVETADIGHDDRLEDLGPWAGNPSENLPQRTPPATQWPRFVRLEERADGTLSLQNLSENWPLLPASPGDAIHVHPIGGTPERMIRLKVREVSGPERLITEDKDGLSTVHEGAWLLASGPHTGP
ncbi:MAG: MOSC domain-containing protein [Aestuariivirgaceae bacterium]